MKTIFPHIRPRTIRSCGIAAGILAIVIVFIWLVVHNERIVNGQRENTDSSFSLIGRSITSEDHMQGMISAPIQIIVFSDLSCGYCKAFFNTTLPRLRAQYGDVFVVAFRHLPLRSHPRAYAEAVASECAYQNGGNDAFWKFVNAVYADPGYERGLSDDRLASIARGIGIPAATFDACVASGNTATRVDTDALEAAVAGLGITPSILFKSPHRALTVSGNYFDQISSAVSYLLEVENSSAKAQ